MKNPFLAFTGIGFELIGLIVLGVWGGGWLDQFTWINKLGVPAGVLLALVIWFVHIFKLLQKINK